MPKFSEMTWIKDFREFAGDTSAHGVKNIFEGPTKILKLLFLITWIVCSVYATFVIFNAIVTFINKPTGTKFQVTVESTERAEGKPAIIKFPTISVCSHNKVKKSFLRKPGNELLREVYLTLDKYDLGEAEELAAKFDDPESEMANVSDITYQQLLADGSPDDSRFLMCDQRKRNCADLPVFEKEYVVREDSMTGRCWRVNPHGKLMGLMGDYGALTLRFWADIQDYSESTKDLATHGFLVAFHDNSTFGSTLSSGYLMSPGTYYKVDLRLRKEIRKPPPGGNCNASLTDTNYGAYTEGSCIMECKDKWLFERCGCVNVVPPINRDNYTSCTLSQWANCGLAAYLDWYQRYTETNTANPICTCSMPCEETNYEAKVSSSDISDPYAEKLFENANVRNWMSGISDPYLNISYDSPEDIRKNMMVVEVLFSSAQVSEIREVVTYTANNLLGDIGGVLGLFLGASLFTILEFFQFIIISIAKHCCNWVPGSGKKKYESAEMS